MKCTKCSSENVQAQVVVKKNPIVTAMLLLFGGLGLMFLGIIGGIIGVILGAIIGGIVKGIMGDMQETVFICLECGHSFSTGRIK